MPEEIDLLKINANGLERVLEANLTNLFGISVPYQLRKQYLFLCHATVLGNVTEDAIGLWLTYAGIIFEHKTMDGASSIMPA